MDTKSTKFKYSLFTKGLCLILSATLFFCFCNLAATVIAGTQVYGFEEYLSGNIPDFYHSYGFTQQFITDNYMVREFAYNNSANIEIAFDSNQKATIDEAVNLYLTEKSNIIKNELEYAVNNYDESYFDYEYTADSVDIPDNDSEPVIEENATTPNLQPEDITDAQGNKIPRNIEAAQKILQSCNGLEFLAYEALVRESAFNETEFYYSADIPIDSNYNINIGLYNSSGYALNESEIRKSFLGQYANHKSIHSSDAETNISYAKETLSRLKTYKYYFEDYKGNIETNVSSDMTAETFKSEAASNKVYVLWDSKKLIFGDLTDNDKEFYKTAYQSMPDCKLYVYIDDDMLTKTDDSYANLYYAYNGIKDAPAKTNITISVLCLISSFILLIAFLCLCGHKNGTEKPVTAFIDKLPTDIHFILSVGAITGLTVLTGWLGIEIINSNIYSNLFAIYAPALLSGILTISYLLFAEWLASAVRIKKADEKFFRRMLIVSFIFAIGRFFRKLLCSIGKLFSALRYQPKKMKRTIILIICGYVSGNILILLANIIGAALIYSEIASIISVIASFIYNAICLYFGLKYFDNLDKIIDASCRHEAVDFGTEKIPESLHLLASNLTNTNEALIEAVNKAVRDEQMKTELITNVSHDLKTPLTSLISYSDLLSKCDINDEDAKKYISVINNQSIKLKRLIEDLIEASKVSSGNVTINASKLNLSELAMQAIAEFAPEMEKNGNEIRFSEPETPPCVYADGAKTYRILSNLLSNAKKYSAPDTRVYVSVYTDSINSYFEIKNISCEPLNISPNELTERFVRGDKSRTKEGNGLGLSIAKDLCTLQNGDLQLFIDGDLFKAIVQLPAKE